MSASLLYRVASFVLVLFAAGHTLGFRKADPRWGAEAVVGAMHNVRFNVGSFNRGYWDFYLGFGYFVIGHCPRTMRRSSVDENYAAACSAASAFS